MKIKRKKNEKPVLKNMSVHIFLKSKKSELTATALQRPAAGGFIVFKVHQFTTYLVFPKAKYLLYTDRARRESATVGRTKQRERAAETYRVTSRQRGSRLEAEGWKVSVRRNGRMQKFRKKKRERGQQLSCLASLQILKTRNQK